MSHTSSQPLKQGLSRLGPIMNQHVRFWYLSDMRKSLQKTHMLAYLTGAIGLYFGLRLHLHPYFVYASSEGSDESAHMRRLT